MSTSALDLWDIQRITKRRAEDMGVTVMFDEGVHTPYYDTKNATIVFPLPRLPMNSTELARLRGYYIHEPLHHMRKDTTAMYRALRESDYDVPDAFMNVWNAVEDDIMERVHSSKYVGDRDDLSRAFHIEQKEINTNLSKIEDWSDVSALNIKMQSVLALLVESRTDWDMRCKSLSVETLSLLPKEAQDLMRTLNEDGTLDRLRTLSSSKESYQFAVELHNLLFPENPPMPEELPPPPSSGGDGEPQEGEGEDGEEDGEGKGEPLELSQETKDKIKEIFDKFERENEEGEKVKIKDGIEISWEELQNTDGSIQQMGGDIVVHHIDWEGKDTSGTWGPCPDEDRQIVDLSEVEDKGRYLKEYDTTTLHDRALANKIRRLIQVKQRVKLNTERKQGKVHNRNIYRVAIPTIGNGDWNSRIFKTKKDGLDIDCAVSVLVDWSGSMDWDGKKEVAAQAAQSLLHVFNKTLHIPVELLMFGTLSKYSFGVVKDFNTQQYTPQSIAKRFHAFNKYAAGNQDPDAVLWAVSRLRQRKERRKMLIVLSDGCPTDALIGCADAGLHLVCKEIRKDGDIDLYGIGILDDNVTRYYGSNAKVINKASELPEVLLQTVREGVIE